MRDLRLIERLALSHHRGHFRKDGKTPYIEHPRAVAKYLEDEIADKDAAYALGMLHDSIEDGPEFSGKSENELISEISAALGSIFDRGTASGILEAIKAVSNNLHSHYGEGLEGAGPLAFAVKICDMRHNLEDMRTLPEGERDRQIRKYLAVLRKFRGSFAGLKNFAKVQGLLRAYGYDL
ncbi:MAG: hypothetical protein AB1529_00200 [Candidatus Micrarchaeota archaeon]